MHSSRQIVSSPRAAQRVAEARAWLEAQKPDTEILLLAANWEAADDLVRAVAASRGALFAIHRLTLNRLIGLLAADDLAARGLVPLSRLATEAVAARAIHRLYPPSIAPGRESAQTSERDFFAAVATRPGFPAAIAETVQEVRLAGVTAQSLAGIERSGPPLAAILEQFEQELEAANLIDRAGLIRIAIAAIGRRPRFVGLPTLMLDVAVTAAADRDLIAALAAECPGVLRHGSLRRPSRPPATSARDSESQLKPRSPGLTAPRARLAPPCTCCKNICLRNRDRRDRSWTISVTISSAPGESRECVEIVRAIAAQAERGVAFDQIAVLLHAPGQYVAHLQEALRRAAIPAYYAAGTRRPEPGGRALLALLACAAESLSARRFAEYLSLAQVPDWDPQRARAAAPFVAPEPELMPAGLGAELGGSAAARRKQPLSSTTRFPWWKAPCARPGDGRS